MLEGPDLVVAALAGRRRARGRATSMPTATAPRTPPCAAVAVPLAGDRRRAADRARAGRPRRRSPTRSPPSPCSPCAPSRTPTCARSRRDGFVLVLADSATRGTSATAMARRMPRAPRAWSSLGESVDVFNPKALRATAGASSTSPSAIRGRSRRASRSARRVAASRRRRSGVARTPWATPISDDAAVVIGSEAPGLSSARARLLDGDVTIPMAGRAESLTSGWPRRCSASSRSASAWQRGPPARRLRSDRR